MNQYVRMLLQALTLQIALLLIALPLFIYWGISLSVASFVATIMFSPFLSIFLLLSSLLFFTQLCAIPNSFFCSLLEYIAQIWQFFLSYANKSWLIGFAQPPEYMLICMFLVIVYVLVQIKFYSISKKCLIISFLFSFFTINLKLYPYYKKTTTTEVACGKKNLFIISHKYQTIVYDPSVLATKSFPDSWISFTLTSELFKQTGTLFINHFIIKTVSNRLLKTLHKIMETCTVKQIYLPNNKTIISEKNPLFLSFINCAKKNNTKITYIEKNTTIMVDLSVQIQIKRKGKTVPCLHVHTIINNAYKKL